MIVEVLTVGTELLLGQIVNSNASDIGRRLAEAGLDHYHQTVVGDNLERISSAIKLAVSRADALVITGGIGPTQDDLTREALCIAAGLPMAFDEEYADRLREQWEARGRTMPDSNLRQAEYPEGAVTLPNPRGSAPGLRIRIGGAEVFAVPGVPAEMRPMVDDYVTPTLREASGEGRGVVVSRVIRTWGESEARVGELLGDLYASSVNPTVAFLASDGEIKVRLTAKAATEEGARTLIDPAEQEVRSTLGSRVFGADGETIESVIFGQLTDRAWTIATAESATGGMIAARITSLPGASDVYKGSVVAYHQDVKLGLLGVATELVSDHGVVSEPVAMAMAEGVAGALGADVGIAVTGSAGPDALDLPVGTMVIAVHTPAAVKARTLLLPGDRERIRTYATTAALHLARLGIAGEWWGAGDGSFWADLLRR